MKPATDTSKAIKRTAKPLSQKDIEKENRINMAMSKGEPLKKTTKKKK